jgi:hypothetical protein
VPATASSGDGRVVALAVAGGIAIQIPFVVAALAFAARLMRPSFSTVTIKPAPAGPLRPRVQACELFYAWERTYNPSLLNQAVADARSRRVP